MAANKKYILVFGNIGRMPVNFVGGEAVVALTNTDRDEEGLEEIMRELKAENRRSKFEIEKGFPHSPTSRQIDKGITKVRQRSQIPCRPVSRIMRGDKK